MVTKKFHEVRCLAESNGLGNDLDRPRCVRNKPLRLKDHALLDHHLGRKTTHRKASAAQRFSRTAEPVGIVFDTARPHEVGFDLREKVPDCPVVTREQRGFVPVRAASDLQEQDVKLVLQDVCAGRRAIATFVLINYRGTPGANSPV
jgi:hypothetical protein